MKLEDLKEALDVLTQLEEADEIIKPLAKKIVSLVVSYGPELRQVFDSAIDYTVERRLRSLRLLEEGGCSREEAVYMTMDEWWGLRRGLTQRQRKKT